MTQESSEGAPIVVVGGLLEKSFEDCGSRQELCLTCYDRVFDSISDRVGRSGATILSLDVFDTFLLRNDKPEVQRFYEVSSEVANCFSLQPWEVFVTRCMAMRLSYRTRDAVEGCREGHFDDILQIQRRLLNLPETVLFDMKRIEMEYESNNLQVNRLMESFVIEFCRRNGRVLFLSDMYLGSSDIRRLISLLSVIDVPFDVISSADAVVSKRSGRLFGYVEGIYGCVSGDFFHIGDNRHSDFVMPIKSGWRALHLPVSKAERRRRRVAYDRFLAALSQQGLDASPWASL